MDASQPIHYRFRHGSACASFIPVPACLAGGHHERSTSGAEKGHLSQHPSLQIAAVCAESFVIEKQRIAVQLHDVRMTHQAAKKSLDSLTVATLGVSRFRPLGASLRQDPVCTDEKPDLLPGPVGGMAECKQLSDARLRRGALLDVA